MLEHDDDARREAFDFLDAWRLAVPPGDGIEPDHNHGRLFSLFVSSALSHPLALVRNIDSRLASLGSKLTPFISNEHRDVLTIPWVFDGEKALLHGRRQLITEATRTDSRAQRFVAWVRSNADLKKVVVFVDDRQLADELASTLRDVMGASAILRYDAGTDAVRAFEERQSLAILVCDAAAEEGLNLQRSGAALAFRPSHGAPRESSNELAVLTD